MISKEENENSTKANPNSGQDPNTAQRDLIIAEIETSDGSLGASLRHFFSHNL